MNVVNIKKKINRKVIAASLMILAAVVVASAFALRASGSDAEEEIVTDTAEVMTIEKTLSADGEVTSSLEEDINPHTSYYLEEIKVEVGDALEEGDTILTYTNGYKMKAPYNCVIKSYSLPDEEEQLTTDHYVTLAGTDVLQMELAVGEDEISLIKAGDSGTVKIESSGDSFEGVVTSVSEVGEYSESGSTFAAVITFENDSTVKVGMSATATVSLDKEENVIGVPVNAVTSNGSDSVVTVQKEDGTTEETVVTTGLSNGAYIEIKSGLSEGDTIVVPVTDDNSSSGGAMGMPGGGEMPPEGGSSNGGPPGGSPNQ